MRPMKLIALLMALCLLASMVPAALMEEQAEAEIALADTVDADTGLTVDDGQEDAAPEIISEPEAGAEYTETDASDMAYCLVGTDGAAVYSDLDSWEPAALLSLNDTVLLTGPMASRAPVAFCADGKVLSGWMELADLLPMDEARTQSFLDALAVDGVGALYKGDLNWPLAALNGVTYGDGLEVLAASYLANDTPFVLNGKEVKATQFPEVNNCWKWSQNCYKFVWGCNFSETFEGKSSTGMNLLANLNDAQRKVTPVHVRYFIGQTTVGATIRVCGCSKSCKSFNNDGLGCGHHGHSMIVADKSADGVTIIDNLSHHARYYTWQGFYDSWGKQGYTYIKYIRWPGVKALPANCVSADDGSISVTGVSLDQTSLTLTVGETATLTATVTPETAGIKAVTWASSDETVANVADGKITALKAGTATIAVKTSDGGFTASCVVTVVKAPVQKKLTRTGKNGIINVPLGEKVQLVPKFATKKKWTVTGVKSSKSQYASVTDTGLITAVAVGKTTITVTTKNKKKATLTVKVYDPTVPTKVKLNKTKTVKLKVGKTLQLKATVLPNTAVTTLAWKSSKESIATVDENGRVTAWKKGTCYVAVRTSNGKVAKVKIKVVK